MLQADLSKLALELALWGVHSPSELSWVTQPPEGAWKSAQALLQQLRLVDSAGMLTPLGKQSAQLPLEPRLATMLIQAASFEAVHLPVP